MIVNPYSFATGGGPPPPEDDPFFASVIALIHVEDTVEEMIGVATISTPGATAISSAHARFGAKSLLCTGDGQNSAGIRMQAPDDYFVFPGEFTWEGWFYPTDYGALRSLFDGQRDYPAAGAFTLQYQSPGDIVFINGANFSTGPSAASALTLNTWQHVALTRDASNVVKLWVAGVLKASATHTGDIGAADSSLSYFHVSRGVAYDNSSFKGFYEEIRVTKEVCRYTTGFTPQATPFADS